MTHCRWLRWYSAATRLVAFGTLLSSVIDIVDDMHIFYSTSHDGIIA
jgi:hypothetical protein